jgi:hypothetical protein
MKFDTAVAAREAFKKLDRHSFYAAWAGPKMKAWRDTMKMPSRAETDKIKWGRAGEALLAL